MSTAAIATALLNDPTVRRLALKGAKAGVKAVGRSRRRRANRGKWYFGKRLGIPPNIQQNTNQITKQLAMPTSIATRQDVTVARRTFEATGTEFLCSVTSDSSPTFSIRDSWVINPAEPYSFLRLSKIAKNFQKFIPHYIEITYVPGCSTATAGTLYLAWSADKFAVTPTTSVNMMGYQGAVNASLYQPCVLRITREMMSTAQKDYYIRDDAEPQSGDVTSTVGKIWLGVSGTAAADTYGHLMVSYHFTCTDPKINTDGSTVAAHLDFGTIAAGVRVAADFSAPEIVGGATPLYEHFPGTGVFRNRSREGVFIIAVLDDVAAGNPSMQCIVDGVAATQVHMIMTAGETTYMWHLASGWREVYFTSNTTQYDLQMYGISVRHAPPALT